MWKPAAVVPEHRWRARIVWTGLLLSIAAYTIWQIWKIFDGYNNISTSLEVSSEVYEFPHLTVCFAPGQGCDADAEIDCAGYALENANVNFNSVDYDVASESTIDGCIGFDLESLNLKDSGVSPEEAEIFISTAWLVSESASTDAGYFNHVTIFTSDGEPTQENTSYLYVPYERLIPSDDALATFILAEVTIGKTTKEHLDGSTKTTFPPLVQSATEFSAANELEEYVGFDVAIGSVMILLRQGSFSRTSVKEISPLDLGNLLGNIGGFWELLIIFWGLLFVATREELEPKLKARDFVKTVKSGKEVLRRRSLSVDSGSSRSNGEERPPWESAFRASSTASNTTRTVAAAAAGHPARPPVHGGVTNGSSTATRRASSMSGSTGGSTSNGNHRHENGVSSASNGSGFSCGTFKRPVVQDVPRRGSMSGSRPQGQAPAPPSYADMTAV